MSNVSVGKEAINGGIKCCEVAINRLETAAKVLRVDFSNAGMNGWHDQKYHDLGKIIENCVHELTKPINELKDCKLKLKSLINAINKYESINL